MAAPKVTIEMTVAEHKAVMNILNVANAFKHLETSMRALDQKGGSAGEKLDKGFNAVTSTIDRAVKAFLSLNMGMQAFSTLVSTVRSEVEAWQKRAQEARPFAVSLATAQQRAQMQLGTGRVDRNGKPFTSDDMVAMIEKAATEKTGLNRLGMYAGIAKTYSTGTELPADVLTELAPRVMELMPEYAAVGMEQEYSQIVGGVANVMKAYWGGGNKIGTDQAIAAYLQFQKISASESPQEFAGAPASYIAAAVKMTSGKEKPENAAALVSVFQQAGMDPQGRRSATNPMELQIEFRERAVKLMPELYGKTMDEMITTLQDVTKESNPKLYAGKLKFLGSFAEGVPREELMRLKAYESEITGNARMKGISAALLMKGSPVANLYSQFKGEVKGAAERPAVEREFKEISRQQARPYMLPLLQENARIAAEHKTYGASSGEVSREQQLSIYSKAYRQSISADNEPQFVAAMKVWATGAAGRSEKSPTAYNQYLIDKLNERIDSIKETKRILEWRDSMGGSGGEKNLTESGKKEMLDAITGLTGAIAEMTAIQKRLEGNAEMGIVPKVEVIRLPPGAPPTEPIEPGS